MADDWNDVARNFALGFSMTSNLEDQRKRQALAEKADARAQETHDSQMWREKQAQSFLGAYDQYNLTGDPNSYLDYAKTYHPQMFPDANASYSITKDPSSGVNTLMMAGQDGAQQPVTIPTTGQPLQFDDTSMQKFLLGHIDPKAMSTVATAKMRGTAEGQAEVGKAEVKGAAASGNQGTASALGMGGIHLVDTGGAIQPVVFNQADGTVTPTGAGFDKTQAPHSIMVNQGNQQALVGIDKNGNYTVKGTFEEGISPNTQATLNAQGPTRALTMMKDSQDILKGQVSGVTTTLNWLNTKYGGNPIDIDPNNPMSGLTAALSLGKSKSFDNMKKQAESGNVEAQKDLEAYQGYMAWGMNLTKSLAGMPGDKGALSEGALAGGQTPAPSTSGPQQETPPAAGAKKAPDGHWYVPDPNRPGKYLRVD